MVILFVLTKNMNNLSVPSTVRCKYSNNNVTVEYTSYSDGWLYIHNFKDFGLIQGFSYYSDTKEAMGYVHHLTTIKSNMFKKLFKGIRRLLTTPLWGPSYIRGSYTANDVTVHFMLYEDGWLYIDNYKRLGLNQGYHKFESQQKAIQYILLIAKYCPQK